MRVVRSVLSFSAALLALSTLSFAVQPDRIAGPIDSGQMVSLTRNVNSLAQAQYDRGSVEPSFRLNYVTLLTVPSASQQRALARLVAEQQNPKSANYHKWLTPEQYADRFGLSQNDVQRITAWLESQGLSVTRVARGRNWIVFSGTAAQVQRALHTEIHRYNVNGEMHFANAMTPSVPAPLSGIAAGFRGLHDFRPKPMGIQRNTGARPFYNSSLFGDLVAPGDVTTIYGIGALYTQGIDGTGQKLAVAGQTDIYLADIADFRTGFGLSPITGCTTNSNNVITICDTSNFQYVQVGTTDPGVSLGDLGEADLDIEWSGAVARNAKIIYVNAARNAGGAFDAYYDAIDNTRAPVISLSYGTCELGDFGFISADEAELTKGNSEGITIVNSSGDTGAAECDFGANLSTAGLAVAYPASSPEVTGVGGTLLPYPASYNGTFFGTTNGTDGGTALFYVPETAWNDDTEIAHFCQVNPGSGFCTGNGIVDAQTAQTAIGISSTGGGPSNCSTTDVNGVCTGGFPQPSWQTVTISGQAAVRFSPDVSLMASPNFPGYIFCTQLAEVGHSGTGSACSPGGAAGITNALALKDSSGNPTPPIVGGTSVSAPVFAGIVVLLNQYLGASTGLGNINPTLYTLAKTPSNNVFHQITSGNNLVYCQPGTPSNQPAALRCPAAVPPATLGVFGYDVSNADATTGYNLVTGLGSVNVNNLALAWAATLPRFTLSANPNATNVVAGHSVNSSITLTAVNGFNSAVTYTCSGTGISCTFNPPSPTTVTPVTATIQTTPNMATGPVTVTVKGVAGAISKTTTVNLTVSTTDQSFTLAAAGGIALTQGNPGNTTITMTPANGFSAALTYTCVEPATLTESSCTVSPSGGTTTNPVTVNVTTRAPSAQLRPLLGRSNRIWYAVLLPGLLGIFFTAGSKRAPRALRLLSFIVVLGLSTLWLGACGSGSSNKPPPDPGTPKGNYTLTINATTGGASPVTGTTTVALTVN
jgi:subtilase family serine protease